MGEIFHKFGKKLDEEVNKEINTIRDNILENIIGCLSAIVITSFCGFYISERVKEYKENKSDLGFLDIDEINKKDNKKLELDFLEVQMNEILSNGLSNPNFPAEFETVVYKNNEYVLPKYYRDENKRTVYWQDKRGNRHYNAGFNLKLH